jgi:spore maturation protein CgeB
MLRLFRDGLRFLFLRGAVLRWWWRRACRRIEADSLRALRRQRNDTAPAAPDPPLGRVCAPARPLRSMLFIGNCMWEQNELFPELRRICALEVLDLRPALQAEAGRPRAETVARTLESFVREARGLEPDAILFYAGPALLSEAAFSVLRGRWQCPLLGMNLDDRVEFFPHASLPKGMAPYGHWIRKFDVNLTNAYAALEWYREGGAAVRYFPQGFGREAAWAEPPSGAEFDYRCSFVGSWKQERGELMEALSRAGVEVTLFGKGWPGGQWVEQPSRVYRRSQLNLGLGLALASGGVTTTKGRDFECPGVGACYLTTYNWELPRLYEIGREILCYRNFEELVEMHDYYVKRPEECLRIAQAAHRRCLAEHTWETRFRRLFRELGFTT